MEHHEVAIATDGRTITWARYYDLTVTILTRGRSRAIREATVDLAGVMPGEIVLDAGCGTGAVAMAVRRRLGSTGQVYGIDAAPQMIAVARRKAKRARLGIDYRVAAVEALPFPDASFDLVISSLMMHHLPVDLQETGLEEVYRTLKPEGRLLVIDFKPTSAHGGHRALPLLVHRRRHAGPHAHHHAHDLGMLLHRTGFVEIETGAMDPYFLSFTRGRAPL